MTHRRHFRSALWNDNRIFDDIIQNADTTVFNQMRSSNGRDYTNKKGMQLKYRNIPEMTVLHTLTVYFDVCHPNWPCVRVRLSVWVWNIRLHMCAYMSKWMAEPQRHFYVRWGCVQWNNAAFSNLKQRKQKRNFEKPQTNNKFMGFGKYARNIRIHMDVI